jgi:hypothetical protein
MTDEANQYKRVGKEFGSHDAGQTVPRRNLLIAIPNGLTAFFFEPLTDFKRSSLSRWNDVLPPNHSTSST